MSARLLHNKLIPLLALISAVAIAYICWARPYQLEWGATEGEIARPMPGDELHGNATFLATRAITIDAAADDIWPWLIQMGWGRAGFYAYDVVENLGSERGIESASHIIPEFQHFRVGDDVPISAVHSMVFDRIEPGKLVVWSGEAPEWGAFAWALYPTRPNQTRLVSRIGWTHHWGDPASLAIELFTEFADHIAVRKVLQGVKDRAEGRVEPFATHIFQLIVYLLAFFLFPLAITLFVKHPLSWQTWLATLASGFTWLATWYSPVSTGIGAGLVLLTAFGLRRAYRPGGVRS